MVDLVGTCPMDFWQEWIAEGDPAGSTWSGEEWGWYTRDSTARLTQSGDRFYVVAHGRLRGYATVTRVVKPGGMVVVPRAGGPIESVSSYVICREGGAVACTLDEDIPGFRGLRERWWPRESERDFPDWMTAGVMSASARRAAESSKQKGRREAKRAARDLFGGAQ